MSKTVTLTFLPASEPPDDDRTVFCSYGTYWVSVKSWADLPKAEECVE